MQNSKSNLIKKKSSLWLPQLAGLREFYDVVHGEGNQWKPGRFPNWGDGAESRGNQGDSCFWTEYYGGETSHRENWRDLQRIHHEYTVEDESMHTHGKYCHSFCH